jgi:dienelactone hydrolase
MVTDVYGHEYINNQLVADEYAKRGYFVVVPDLFNGDAAPANPPAGYNLREVWFPKHSPAVTEPIVEKALAAVKNKYSPKYIVASGYCFGAKFAIRLLGDSKINVAGVFHPSFVNIDEVKAIKGPIFIGAAETDQAFTTELRHETESVLAEMKATYQLSLFSGVAHGFAIRGDITVPDVKYAKEQVLISAVAFFDRFAN